MQVITSPLKKVVGRKMDDKIQVTGLTTAITRHSLTLQSYPGAVLHPGRNLGFQTADLATGIGHLEQPSCAVKSLLQAYLYWLLYILTSARSRRRPILPPSLWARCAEKGIVETGEGS